MLCSKRNIQIIHIDISKPIEEQGQLDLIVHKTTDLVAKVERGDKEAKMHYERFLVREGFLGNSF
jgi:inositol-1,3,4-trisphosphate 5/6-kinase/inositol-tetrakisphosphate 1-kinase